MDKYLLEYAIFKNYKSVIREVVGGDSEKSQLVDDIYWLAAALKTTVEERNYKNYGLSAEMITNVCNFWRKDAPPGSAPLISDKRRFILNFHLKFMDILSKIGHDACERLAEMVQTELQCETMEENDLTDIEKKYVASMFDESRQYVFNVLVKDARAKNFAVGKFPNDFDKFDEKISKEIALLLKSIWEYLPTPVITEVLGNKSKFDSFTKRCNGEVQAMMFCDKFRGRREVGEKELLDFIVQIRNSQLTITQPRFTDPPQSQALVEPVDDVLKRPEALTGSDDLFSSPSRNIDSVHNSLVANFNGSSVQQGGKDDIDMNADEPMQDVSPPPAEPFPNDAQFVGNGELGEPLVPHIPPASTCDANAANQIVNDPAHNVSFGEEVFEHQHNEDVAIGSLKANDVSIDSNKTNIEAELARSLVDFDNHMDIHFEEHVVNDVCEEKGRRLRSGGFLTQSGQQLRMEECKIVVVPLAKTVHRYYRPSGLLDDNNWDVICMER